MEKGFLANLSRSAQEQYLIQEEILKGEFGPPGSPFMTTRALAELRSVSVVTAHKIMTGLCEAGYLRLQGKKYYLSYSKLAESLQNRTQIIGLLIPSLSNEFYASLSDKVVEIAGQYGYRVLVMTTGYSIAEEQQVYKLLQQLSVSGILSCLSTSQQNLKLYQNHPIPCVFLTHSVDGLKKSSVQVNSFSISQKVARHLIEQGYKKFFYIGTKNMPISNDERYAGFSMELQQAGFILEEDCVFQFTRNDKIDFKTIAQTLDSQTEPIGVFCYHDLIASQLYRACYKLGKQIPKDVGIVGFDDLAIATALYPPLTSVRYRIETMADTALNQLFANMKNPRSAYDNYYVEPTLIERRSSKLSEYAAPSEDAAPSERAAAAEHAASSDI